MLRRLILCFAIAAFGAAAPPAKAGAQADTASQFIQELADRAIGVLSAPGTDPVDREATFRGLLNERFDLASIGRFVLGRHWSRADEAQRSAYLDAFGEYVLQTWFAHLGAYSGEALRAVGERDAGGGDVLVHSRIERPAAAPVAVDWRVRPTADGYRVIDVVVEGVSMALTQRSEFGSVVRRSGVDGLIEAIRARAGKAGAMASSS